MKTKITTWILVLMALSTNISNAQWQQANTGLTINEVNSFAVIGTKIFAGTGNISGNGHGVFMSADNGGTWTAVNTGLVSLDVRKIIAVGTTLYVAIAGTNITDGGIYKSTDNGSSWNAVNNGLPRKIAYSIAHMGTTLYATINAPASMKDVYLSTDDGGSWTKTTDMVLNNNTVKSIVTIGGNIIIASDNGTGGVFLSTDNGSTWAATSITGDADALAVIGTTVFAATGTGVFKSVDNGVTWTATTNTSGVIDNATALAVIGTNLIVATPGGRVFSSNNSGTNWNDISTGASMNLGAEAFGMDANYIYAGINFKTVGIWRRPLSELGGGTPAPNPPSNLTVTPGKMQLGGQMNLSWTDNSSDEAGFIIARSTDSTNFTMIDTVLANITMFSDTGLPASTKYYYKVAAYNSSGNSAYSNTIGATTLPTGIRAAVNVNELGKIYPNPTSGMIRIEWVGNDRATLQLINTLGEEILKQQVTGTIDISNSPKGIYFVKITDANGIYSRKIILQ